MPTLNSSGTQLAVIATEHVLVTLTTNKFFTGYIDLTNMASGDTTVIKISIIAKTAGLHIQYWSGSYVGVQANPLVYLPPLPSDISYKVTLTQSAGTGRNYDWRVFEV